MATIMTQVKVKVKYYVDKERERDTDGDRDRQAGPKKTRVINAIIRSPVI